MARHRDIRWMTSANCSLEQSMKVYRFERQRLENTQARLRYAEKRGGKVRNYLARKQPRTTLVSYDQRAWSKELPEAIDQLSPDKILMAKEEGTL